MRKPILIPAFTVGVVFSAVQLGWCQGSGDISLINHGSTGSLFLSILAGVMLAIGFEILLTILSVASGVSILGDIRERFSVPEEDAGHPGLSISNGVGLWVMATTSLSLFLASLFAVKLSFIPNNGIGATLGLTIWAAFFIVMSYLEMRTARSILGGILSTVFAGLKNSTQFVQDIFGKPPAEKTAHAVRSEILETLNDPHLATAVNAYIKKFQPSPFNWSKAKSELKKLLTEFEVKASIRNEQGIERETFISLAEKHPHLSRQDIEKFGDIYDEVKQTAQKSAPKGAGQVLEAIEKIAPISDDDSRKVRQKFEDYLRSAGVEALNPESLKEDLHKIVSDPKSTKQVVLNRIKQFDHPTIVSIVAKKTDMSQEQASQVVNRVEKALEGIKEKAATVAEKNESLPSAAISKVKDKVDDFQSAFEEKVKTYFNSLQRPEFDYDQIKRDFEEMFHDPKATPEIIKNRMKAYDRESLLALVKSWPNVSAQDAQRILDQIEDARHNILRKAEEIEERVRLKTEEARQTALKQGEAIRRSVMVSAWWLLATAALSAFASAVGGMLALS